MTNDRIEQLRHNYDEWCHDKTRHEVLDEIERLRAMLPPSDDGEPVTAEWLESVGLRGTIIDRGDVTVEVHECGSAVSGDCFCIELKCQTRGDARRLASVFGFKMREGDE